MDYKNVIYLLLFIYEHSSSPLQIENNMSNYFRSFPVKRVRPAIGLVWKSELQNSK